METLAPTTQDDSSGANPSSVKSDDSSPRHESGRGSPPPNCAICLGTCRNNSFTDSCLHQFCFKCLLTWSKVKPECPLCKQTFRSIIHNVRSNHQYEEYMVEQRQTEEATERIDINTLATTRRFRYRTTLTLPRRESLAIQQLLLHYPMMADVLPAPPPAARAPRRRSPAAFRRTVYRHNLWARPLPDFTGRFRDCSPLFYRYNDSQVHRLVPWLTRELHYLLNENVGHISYVITRILEILPQYHINSPEFRETMLRYFGDRTDHFLHELYCFASTPYDMTGYDHNVQYTTVPAPARKSQDKDRKADNRRPERESRRLKSVVKVVNGHKNSSDSNSNGSPRGASDTSAVANSVVANSSSCSPSTKPELGRRSVITHRYALQPATKHDTDGTSDSEDDLPLNLTVKRNSCS
ncbi:PREDICTED: E3 ubiquitin-protein ligase Topors-like [Papilio polytes]|uniref:E3 ubiquitin-protein ligase Topors-like n=1 Tax=Papilio polytes TaxID=76194 RepID=UPI0006767E6A|nr:PREDICTED: E3 ubiquitin-protein ligase Topors-like [Papilio polytes]